jgi:hypothetical protein
MEQTEIDGVPVFWAEGPAPMTATLAFGCGARDETFRTIGVTHLIEHLAMSTLPRLHHEHNASVDMEITQFFATGKPGQLVDFLRQVCEALSDLPLDRIDKEAGVLAAEGSQAIHPTAGTLLARRFGTSGYGLAPWLGPGFDRLPASAVAEHAGRFFTKGNAVLALTGPPPEGLRLPLPEGPRPVHQLAAPLPVDGPRWSAEAVPCPGLSVTGPAKSAPRDLGLQILRERLTTIARREKGISYEVGIDWVDVDPTTSDRMIWVDAREGQETEVANILWDTVRQLATFGPTPDELAHEVAAFAEVVDDPRTVEADLDLRARTELLGQVYHSGAEWLTILTAVTADQVATAFSDDLRTALLVVPEPYTLELSDVDGKPIVAGGCDRTTAVPDGKTFRPPMRARMLNGSARRTHLILTPTAIGLHDDDGDIHLVPFRDVVGIEVHEGTRTVFGRYGCVVPVDPELFRGAEAAVAALDNGVDPALRYPRTELISYE